jgi:dihydrofolate reductase
MDGCIARSDGGLDWLIGIEQVLNEDYGFHAFMASIDSLVMGRGTYEVAASVETWPYLGKRVVVLSNTLTSICEHAELASGDIHAVVAKLHADGIKHIYVDGGKTISQFLNAGLVDDMTLTIVPVVLGSGIRLFHDVNRDIKYDLVSSQSYANGLVQLRYVSKS